MLHGVSLAAAIWAPWLAHFAGYRALLVELPGHGLSGPVAYRRGAVRDHTLRLMDDLFDALGLATAPVVGHSLGGMFALWYAAARPGRIASLVAIGDPAVALPGATVRMPLSLLTVPALGEAVLRTPMHRGGCTGGCSDRDSALLPLRPRLTSCWTCSAWLPAVTATPGPSVRSCTRSTASAGPARTASCPAASSAGLPSPPCSAGVPGTRFSLPRRPVPRSPRFPARCFMRSLAGTAPGWRTAPTCSLGPAVSPRGPSGHRNSGSGAQGPGGHGPAGGRWLRRAHHGHLAATGFAPAAQPT